MDNYTLNMSTKKTKANGASTAPSSSIISTEKSLASTAKKTNGKQPNGKHANGNGKHTPEKNGNTPEAIYHSEAGLDPKALLKVLAEVRSGNFTVRMPNDNFGLTGKIYDTLNEIITLNEILVQELNEARKMIGKQGKLNHRVELPSTARGSWRHGS